MSTNRTSTYGNALERARAADVHPDGIVADSETPPQILRAPRSPERGGLIVVLIRRLHVRRPQFCPHTRHSHRVPLEKGQSHCFSLWSKGRDWRLDVSQASERLRTHCLCTGECSLPSFGGEGYRQTERGWYRGRGTRFVIHMRYS